MIGFMGVHHSEHYSTMFKDTKKSRQASAMLFIADRTKHVRSWENVRVTTESSAAFDSTKLTSKDP